MGGRGCIISNERRNRPRWTVLSIVTVSAAWHAVLHQLAHTPTLVATIAIITVVRA
jgi:hypothetical protein